MNKNIFLVLAIIFMVIVVTGTGGWLTSSAWADGIESALPSRTAKRKIDGRIYCIESVSEGAAGTVYTQYTYSTIKNSSLIMVSCVIRYPQCINYSEPYRTECANERETFDLDKIIGYIVKNLSVKKAE